MYLPTKRLLDLHYSLQTHFMVSIFQPEDDRSSGPPTQSTGPPKTDAGVGIGMKIEGNLIFGRKGQLTSQK